MTKLQRTPGEYLDQEYADYTRLAKAAGEALIENISGPTPTTA